MTVYVDNMQASYGRMVMCHMIADTDKELLDMCDIIGVQKKWIQHVGTYKVHFDIAQTKRAAAVRAGAVEITLRQYAFMVNSRKEGGAMCSPQEARELYFKKVGRYEDE